MPVMPENKSQRNSSEQRYYEAGNNSKEKRETKAPFDKLPIIKISKILKKIGAGDRNKVMFVPNEEDQASFRKSKWEELSR